MEEGQYPEWYKGKKFYAPGKGPITVSSTGSTHTAALADTTPTSSIGSASDQFDFMALMANTMSTTQGLTYADLGASDHCFIKRDDFLTYQIIPETDGQTAQVDAMF